MESRKREREEVEPEPSEGRSVMRRTEILTLENLKPIFPVVPKESKCYSYKAEKLLIMKLYPFSTEEAFIGFGRSRNSTSKETHYCGLCFHDHQIQRCFLFNYMERKYSIRFSEFLKSEYKKGILTDKKIFDTAKVEYFRELKTYFPSCFYKHIHDETVRERTKDFKYDVFVPFYIERFKIILDTMKTRFPRCTTKCQICKSHIHCETECILIDQIISKYPNIYGYFTSKNREKTGKLERVVDLRFLSYLVNDHFIHSDILEWIDSFISTTL